MQAIQSGFLVFILLVTGGLGSFFDSLFSLINIADVHTGEQTAQILPADTDVYLTINLRPGISQLEQARTVLDAWLGNPSVDNASGDVLSQFETFSGINIATDIIPWVGPEMGVGFRYEPDFMATGHGPIATVIVGTFDRAQSDAFIFGKLFPFSGWGGATAPTGPTGSYRGIDTVNNTAGNKYWAFTSDYIFYSETRTRLEATLDLYLGVGGASLAGTANFTAAQANIPAERTAMAYFNIGGVLEGQTSMMETSEGALIRAIEPYLPSFIAGSAYFVTDGLKVDYYYPSPAGMAGFPEVGPPSVAASKMLPSNALGILSTENLTSWWEWLKPGLEAEWSKIKEASHDPAFPASLDAFLTQAKVGNKWLPLGFNWDTDVFSWMNGEVSFAFINSSGRQSPRNLLAIEIDDPTLVQAKLETVFAGLNEFSINAGSGPVGIVPANAYGYPAFSINWTGFKGTGLSPSYAFVNVDGSDYVVFGTTLTAVGVALMMANNPEAAPTIALDQDADYQWMAGNLPASTSGSTYFDLRQTISTLRQTPYFFFVPMPKPPAPVKPTPVPAPTTAPPYPQEYPQPMAEPTPVPLPEPLPPNLINALVGPLHSMGGSEAGSDPSGKVGTILFRIQAVDSRVFVAPDKVQREIGDNFTLDVGIDEVWADNSSDIHSVNFTLCYDPVQLSVFDADITTDGVQIRPIIPPGVGSDFVIQTNSVNLATGLIKYSITLGQGAPAFPPATIVASIDFQAIKGSESYPAFFDAPVLLDGAGNQIASMWEGGRIRTYRLPEIIQTQSNPSMAAIMGMFRSGAGDGGTNLIVEVNPNTDKGGAGVGRVTANLTPLVFSILPSDIVNELNLSGKWKGWLDYMSNYDIYRAGPTVFRRYFNLWEIVRYVADFTGQYDIQSLTSRLQPGTFVVPVTVRDIWGDKVEGSLELTIVDAEIPLQSGWNLVSTPVRLDDNFTTWEKIYNLSQLSGVNAAVRFDTVSGNWTNVTPDYRIKPLDGIYVHATEQDQLGMIFARNPTLPPVRPLESGWNLIGPALSPTDWDAMPVNEAVVSLDQDVNGMRGYSVVVNPGRQLNQYQQYSYTDNKGGLYYFGGYGWRVQDNPWVYTVGSSDVKNMTAGGGYWVYMEHPDLLAGFSTTPITVVIPPSVPEPGYDLGNVPRYYYEQVKRTVFEDYSVGGYTKIFIKYVGNFSPSQAFEFYQKVMPQYGWKLIDWHGEMESANMTFRKAIGAALFDCQIDIGQWTSVDSSAMQEINILYELREPGVDLPDIPRLYFGKMTTVISAYSRDTNDLGTDTFIEYSDPNKRFMPIEAYKFYIDVLPSQFGWQFDSGSVDSVNAALTFHRTDSEGKKYRVDIKAVTGQIKIFHHVSAPIEQPQYGGVLNMAWSSAPQYFDDALGNVVSAPTLYLTNDELLSGNWKKGPAGSRETTWLYNHFPSPNTLTGSLAQSWEIPDSQTLIFHIRPGVHFQNKSPVNGREMTAFDVADSLKRLWTTNTSMHYTAYPWNQYFQELDGGPSINATDKYTVEIKSLPGMLPKIYEIAGDQSRIIPSEVTSLSDWHDSIGTGPFILDYYATDNTSANFTRNSNYWMMDPRYTSNRLPYLDGIEYLIIPDYSTRLAAFRTGKIDLLAGPGMSISWGDAENLKKTNPELKYVKYLGATAPALFMRTDNASLPFDDILVRQALALAIDKKAIKDNYYGGNAEILASPIAPVKDFMDMYTTLDQLPQSTQELYGYDPMKAKQLLTDAGYPEGFKTKIVCNTNQVDLASIIRQYWLKVGVDATIDVKEMGPYRSIGTNKTYTDIYMANTSDNDPFGFINYRQGAQQNYSMINDTYLSDKIAEIDANYFDESLRRQQMKALVPYILEQSYIVQLPEPYVYNFWQPWVRGYHGEVYTGRSNIDFAKYIWIDQDMKQKMTGGQ